MTSAAFLTGLKKLGKGRWREISRYYVPTRTSTQIASHAQKYAQRVAGATKRVSKFTKIEQQVASPPSPCMSAVLWLASRLAINLNIMNCMDFRTERVKTGLTSAFLPNHIQILQKIFEARNARLQG